MDTLEIEDKLYMAFLPADMDVNDEDYGVVILKVEYEGDEELLVTIDDDDECERVFAAFNEILFADDDEDSDDENSNNENSENEDGTGIDADDDINN